MKKIEWRMVIGFLLLAFGGLLMLQTFNILPYSDDFEQALVSLVFLAGGSIFLIHLFNNKAQNWWAVIPASALIALGIIIFGDAYFPRFMDDVGGGVFLGGIAAAFWIIYLTKKPDFWWALIPAGILSTLALIAIESISNILPAEHLFLFGTSATFAMVGLTVKPKEKYQWAWIPAGILFGIGCINLMVDSQLTIVMPILLIIIGLAILIVPSISKTMKRNHYE